MLGEALERIGNVTDTENKKKHHGKVMFIPRRCLGKDWTTSDAYETARLVHARMHGTGLETTGNLNWDRIEKHNGPSNIWIVT